MIDVVVTQRLSSPWPLETLQVAPIKARGLRPCARVGPIRAGF